ncbi:MAG: hypothetical protein H0T89_29830 [Deltaproteobacteria bacterium]|nr:hypothetical protein [Deltaproteobacteria bacterium]MDQ3298826.1 hypothetical protein [Myxococcota bacterium]
MKPDNSSQGGNNRNQGEGDKVSARHYNRHVREFVANGKVEDAAREAKMYVERDPADAERAEQRARRGPKGGTRVSVDELMAKGRSVVDRVRPMALRLKQKLLSRFGR